MQDPLNSSYPVLPLRDIVVFPHMIVPLFVGREKSVRALEEVMADDKQILLSSQIDPAVDDPEASGIYKAGVLANVLQLLKLPDGTVKVLVEGVARVRIVEYLENEEFFEARCDYLTEMPGDQASIEALLRTEGRIEEPAPYGDQPYVTTRAFWESGQALRLLEGEIAIDCPVRLLQGQADPDVPWDIALRTAAQLRSSDVQTLLIKDGDHRLSRDGDIALLIRTVSTLLDSL